MIHFLSEIKNLVYCPTCLGLPLINLSSSIVKSFTKEDLKLMHWLVCVYFYIICCLITCLVTSACMISNIIVTEAGFRGKYSSLLRTTAMVVPQTIEIYIL